MIKANAVIGQSGGPTSVINASLAGVMEEIKKSERIESLFGMNCGIEGFLKEELFNLDKQPELIVRKLRFTPSSALGSSRHKLKDDDLPKILEVLKKYNIRYVFLIGGNDTMDTINRLELYCTEQKYDLIGIGIPKTVDNDLFGTDHTPGFASAAKSNILNVLQGGWLARDMQKVDKYVIYQTIGRDAGWLAASTALSKKDEDDAPHLIYPPETIFDKDKFLHDVKKTEEKYGWVSIVVSEGLKYSDGTPVSSSQRKDKFNNIEFGAMGGASVGLNVHKIINEEFGWRGEFQITESLIMSDYVRSVPNDNEEAYQCGVAAVRLAENEESGYMVSINRISNSPYKVSYEKALLTDVAVRAKSMPAEFMNKEGNFPSSLFMEYLIPLIDELPDFSRLERNFIKL
ncbi:MAG: diphosphate--fructose-6-phosphate 1-phosphotransferase [Bacteroidota bacterium]|nr:diphosphate--fructose-6-phosphate 1-phosphotransferase [Bacteroidota bacterium]